MAQFRTTADIADEVLQKSGEVINGNSQYESLVLTYLNKAHQAIVGGGSIFSVKVDEAWSWARSRHPIVLEMQPAFKTGQIQVTNGDVNITFTDAPALSVEGWHLQVLGKRTVYRITAHASADTMAQLDSSMIEDTGTYQFRCFKLDYEIFPAYIYIDNKNDRLDIAEAGSTQITVSLTHGAYTPATFITHVIARLNAVGTTGLYSGSYDPVLKLFTIISSGAGGKILSFLGASGTNRGRSSLPLLGFDQRDFTGALTYTSTYVLNGISRLVEPFKVFTNLCSEPFVTSSDPYNMELDYPTEYAHERTPDKFCFINEDNDGTKYVRFNAYPTEVTKVLIDWVPMPHDLQDNVASIPLIPRRDIDVLIHAASAFILFDKEDDKWQGMLQLTGTQLTAMEKKNRSELFRTGPAFGQISPRLDLTWDKRRRLRYGYTVSEAVGSAPTASESAQTLITRNFTYADFQTGSTSITVNARTLPANRTLFSIIVKHSIPFLGGSISALALDVGISGDPTRFINGFNIMQAVSSSAQDSSLVIFYPGVATDIQIRVTATGANLSDLSQGALAMYFNESVIA